MGGRGIRQNGRPKVKTERMPRWIVPLRRSSRARCLLVEAWTRRDSAFSRAWVRSGGTVLLLLPPLKRKEARVHNWSALSNLKPPAIIPRRVALWRGCLDSQANTGKLKDLLLKLQANSWKLFLHDSPPCHLFSPLQYCGRRGASPGCIACARLKKCCKTCRQRLVKSKQRQGMQRLRRARALQNLVPWVCATHGQPERSRMVNRKWPSVASRSTPKTATISMCGLGVPSGRYYLGLDWASVIYWTGHMSHMCRTHFEPNLLRAELILTAGDMDVARGREAHAGKEVALRMHKRVFASRAKPVCWVQRR